jgi:hypothetical protein
VKEEKQLSLYQPGRSGEGGFGGSHKPSNTDPGLAPPAAVVAGVGGGNHAWLSNGGVQGWHVPSRGRSTTRQRRWNLGGGMTALAGARQGGPEETKVGTCSGVRAAARV